MSWSATDKVRINQLGENEVHVWSINLVQPVNTVQFCKDLLSVDELARARKFYFEQDRNAFIIAHGAARDILGSYSEIAPKTIIFKYSKAGKPSLAYRSKPRLEFNLSHSCDIALIAIAYDLPLGIDIERIRNGMNQQSIADRFFSPWEINTLRRLPKDHRVEGFYLCWTRKEAYLKARGDGLSIPINSFDVEFRPGKHPALLQMKSDPLETLRWSFYNLEIVKGYKGALVVTGRNRSHHLKFSWWKEYGLRSGSTYRH